MGSETGTEKPLADSSKVGMGRDFQSVIILTWNCCFLPRQGSPGGSSGVMVSVGPQAQSVLRCFEHHWFGGTRFPSEPRTLTFPMAFPLVVGSWCWR